MQLFFNRMQRTEQRAPRILTSSCETQEKRKIEKTIRKLAKDRDPATPINRVSVIAQFKIRQGQRCRKLLLSS